MIGALLLLVGPGLAFATLVVTAHRLSGRRALVATAFVWLAVSAAIVVASLPPAEQPAPHFARSPAVGILATLAGTAAGVAVVFRRHSIQESAVLLVVESALAYAFASAIAGVLVFYALLS